MEQEKKKKKLSLESTVLLTVGFTALGIVVVGFVHWMLSFF